MFGVLRMNMIGQATNMTNRQAKSTAKFTKSSRRLGGRTILNIKIKLYNDYYVVNFLSMIIYIYKSLGLRKKNPQQKKRKSRISKNKTKLNTKPLKIIKIGAGSWGRGPGGQTRARHGYPHLVYYKFIT
jgi:hypothetical protein